MPCPCTALDVGAALDGSGSISPAEFQDLKGAVQTLVNSLNVAPTGDHVALVLYSTNVHSSFALSGDRPLVDSRINGMTRPGGLTRTDLAIKKMADLLLPGRLSVPKVSVSTSRDSPRFQGDISMCICIMRVV